MSFQIRIIGLLCVLTWLLCSPGQSFAQGEVPSFQSDADYTFGQTMNFRLKVEHLEAVETVTLFFHTPDFPNTYSVDVPFSGGDTVEAHYSVDLTQVRLAPFTTVSYWWSLTTAAGEEVLVSERIMAYDDNQFDWRELSQDGLTVYWTGEDTGLGQLALDIVAESLPRLQTVIPVFDVSTLRLYIYPSSADLRAALRLTGLDWVAAHANSELGVLLVTSVNSRTAASDLRQSIPHELTHFLLYNAVGASHDSLPVWFNEGLSTYMESVTNPSYEVLLQTAVENKTTISLAELCYRFPLVEERALLAYAQSASVIHFIQSRYGNRKLAELVDVFADGADCQTGTSRVLNMDLAELERAWLLNLQPSSLWNRLLVENGIWMLLLVGGFAVTRLLVYYPQREKRDLREHR